MIGEKAIRGYMIPPSLSNDLVPMLRQSNDEAVMLVDEEKREVGVLLTSNEYSLLCAIRDLAMSPEGPAKLAGTFEYDLEDRTQ